MIDVSWGELFVITGLGFALIGKKDLPKAAGFVGNRVGRIVGLLQGARARADSFGQQSELKQLHSELRAGLRELDAVKSEMAVAMSSRSSPGFSMNRSIPLPSQPVSKSQPGRVAPKQAEGGGQDHTTTKEMESLTHRNIPSGIEPLQPDNSHNQIPSGQSYRSLPPKNHAVAAVAVAEEEWEKQGIGFRSRAERGVGLGYGEEQANDPLNSGSSILNNIIQQNLIFDQYDRIVQEQDSILQSKIDDIQARRKKGENDTPSTEG